MADQPPKEDLIKELRRLLNTLTEDAQKAAAEKCKELGFDPNKGPIPLDETFINLTHARDVLLDAIEKRKLAELPLKVQRQLFAEVSAVTRELDALMGGTDATVNLASAVEDLHTSIWTFQLQNLTGHLLGFQSKMNQLKHQEVVLREALKVAEELQGIRRQADTILTNLSDPVRSVSEAQLSTTRSLDQIQTALREATETSQRIAGIGTQVEQHATSSGQQLAVSKQASADTEIIATRIREYRDEIANLRNEFQELASAAKELSAKTEKTAAESQTRFATSFDETREATAKTTTLLATRLETTLAEFGSNSTAKLDGLVTEVSNRTTKLIEDGSAKLAGIEASHTSATAVALNEFQLTSKNMLETWVAKSNESLTTGDQSLKKLVSDLNELESQIRDSIKRATGHSLFHAFQARQEEIVKAKNLWKWALAGCVALSLLASAGFIWYLSQNQNVVYNAAFYLKLSISVPIIYAIAFCNMQYSRERKLEEEYAFKSSISISLDPYQRLVGDLVDKNNSGEVAKYTAFVIESIGRVFTSPTGPVFDGAGSESTDAAGLINALTKFLDPFVKGLRRS